MAELHEDGMLTMLPAGGTVRQHRQLPGDVISDVPAQVVQLLPTRPGRDGHVGSAVDHRGRRQPNHAPPGAA